MITKIGTLIDVNEDSGLGDLDENYYVDEEYLELSNENIDPQQPNSENYYLEEEFSEFSDENIDPNKPGTSNSKKNKRSLSLGKIKESKFNFYL